ncbi:glycosyltransferase family 2 protein [Agromyces sp. SYSU T00194]|uniref:glycosyltransferase family 2 protein n=1 Tax=Agromyces chitinivorans TaxID=3158560 RepID=UPI003393BE54
MATEAMPGSSVLVVTVAYHSSDTIAGFLASVPHALGSARADVVVADNASADADRTRGVVESAGASFVALPENLGYGAGIDAGIDAAAGAHEYLLIANPDLVLHEGAVARLIDAAQRHPDAAALGPRILAEDGSTYPSARRFPALGTGIGHAVLSAFAPGNRFSRRYRADDDYEHERTADWLSGSCLLVRADAYRAVGGFDHRFFMYFEDVDLGRRLVDAGWRNVYVPDAVATHLGARSTSTNPRAMLHEHHRSAYRYLSLRYPHWYQAPLRWALRAALAVRARWETRGMR